MTELLTAFQMRAIENAAIESGEVNDLELMERGGRGVVEAIFEERPDASQKRNWFSKILNLSKSEPLRAVILCGPGNNGGDGFVIARLLKERGWQVVVHLYRQVEDLPPSAKVILINGWIWAVYFHLRIKKPEMRTFQTE